MLPQIAVALGGERRPLGTILDAATVLIYILPNNPVKPVGPTGSARRLPGSSRNRVLRSRNWNRCAGKTRQALSYESAEMRVGEPLARRIQARRLAKLRWARRRRTIARSCAPGLILISRVLCCPALSLSRASMDECSTENSGRRSTGCRPGTGCLEGCECGRRRRS